MIKKYYLLLILLIISGYSQALMLNLKDTNIRTLIGTVSMATGKNFLIDPRVKGTINVITSSDIDDDQLYHLFLAVMKIHGFVVIDGEDFSRILPKNLTKSESAKQLSRVSDEIVSTVVAINNVDASQIVPIIRPLMSQYGHLAVYKASNSLIVVDSQTNIERLKNLLKELDKSVDSDFETITLKHTGATEMAQIIKTLIISKNLGSALNMVVDKHNNQIIISGAEEKRLKVRLLIAEIDKQQHEVSGTNVVYLNYANAKDILPTLQNIAKQSDEETGAGKNQASKRSNVTADEATNAIIIIGSDETTRRVKYIIEKLDIRRAQVLIEAIIAEISLNDSKELGVEWIAKGGNGVGVINASSVVGTLLTGNTQNLNIASGASLFGVGDYDREDRTGFGMIISALQGTGKANILSTPSIVTLDNEEAEISVGQEVSITTGQVLGSNNSNAFQTSSREKVGLVLNVKPQINNGSSVRLDIEQEISNILPSAVNADIVTSNREIKTSVLIEDGQLLVLGGLVDEAFRDSENKFPILGDIPVLGALFTQTAKAKEKRNLVVFIRPTILTNPEVASKVSDEKYKYIQALQLLKKEDAFFSEDIFDETINNSTQINNPVKRENTNVQEPQL